MKPDEKADQAARAAARANWPVHIGKLSDDHDWEYMKYWLSRPMSERLAAMETLRQQMHGEDYAAKMRIDKTYWHLRKRGQSEDSD